MGKKKKTPQAAEEAVALGTVQCRGSSRGFYDMNGYYFSLSLFVRSPDFISIADVPNVVQRRCARTQILGARLKHKQIE